MLKLAFLPRVRSQHAASHASYVLLSPALLTGYIGAELHPLESYHHRILSSPDFIRIRAASLSLSSMIPGSARHQASLLSRAYRSMPVGIWYTGSIVSNAFSRSDQLPGMAFLPKATGGIYAPTLRFRGGIFYLMTTLVNQQLPRVNDSRWDNSLVTTEDPYSSEAWSDPVHFSFPGFDPSPFWDDDGTTYVSGAHTAAYCPGIMHAPLDLETGEIGNILMPCHRMERGVHHQRVHTSLSAMAGTICWQPKEEPARTTW